MARRNKLLKFTELLTFPNVFQNFDPSNDTLIAQNNAELKMAGKWRKHQFKNNNPIVLELACGRGEYSLALGQRYPNKNFIGIDIKGARIWKGAKIALERNLNNVAFLRTKIEFCEKFFAENEVDEIWITFPDPFLKSSKYNRRLSSPGFLKIYKNFLKREGEIHLKTDSPELYEHTLEVMQELNIHAEKVYSDIYAEAELPHPDLDIKTYYEYQHLADGRKIKYIRFKLTTLQSDSNPEP